MKVRSEICFSIIVISFLCLMEYIRLPDFNHHMNTLSLTDKKQNDEIGYAIIHKALYGPLAQLLYQAKQDHIPLSFDTNIVYGDMDTFDHEAISDETALPPLYSDYTTGLAVKFQCEQASLCTSWLEKYASAYGFILRYPKGKEMITKVLANDWHYHYVGQMDAEIMQKNHLCLEEYRKEEKRYGNIES